MYLLIFFSLFHFTVFIAGLFLFLGFFFFLLLLFFQHVALSSSFLFFFFLYASVCSGFFFFFSFLLIFWRTSVFSDHLRGNLVRNHIMTICLFFGTKLIYVVLSSADSCRNIHIYTGYVPTQWTTDAGRLLYKNIYLSLYCKGSKRVTQGLHVRGNWRPNITEIFCPQSYGRQRCVILVLQGCSTRALESILLGAGFPSFPTTSPLSPPPTLINCPLPATQLATPTVFCSIRRPYLTFKLPRSDMDTPPRLRNFFRYLAIGMCHFRYLWNGLCDRHRAEITVIQFRGHSLPLRQSMRV